MTAVTAPESKAAIRSPAVDTAVSGMVGQGRAEAAGWWGLAWR